MTLALRAGRPMFQYIIWFTALPPTRVRNVATPRWGQVEERDNFPGSLY